MKYRKLAPSGGDYTFGRNAQNFVTGELAVAQAVKTNLLLLQGEWWEDTSKGMPVLQKIVGTGRPDNLKAADVIIQSAILAVPGVVKIVSYKGTLNSSNRTYSIACTINTQYGDSTVTITY